MELFLLPYHQHNPTLLHRPPFPEPITSKRLLKRNSHVLPSAGLYVCDVAEAVSTSRRALRGAKIPESEFTTLPNGLKYYDLKVGGGAEAVTGSRVAVHYVAKWKGITFMTSRQGLGVGGGTPYGFDVGQSERGSVLKGLDLGVKGMKVGGQRLLIVPPELAYGSKGIQEIPPNATIELDVELLAIKQSPFGSPVKIVEDLPECGSIKVPYPLSTNPDCGDPDYSLHCDPSSKKLYVDALNGSYYLVLQIMALNQRMLVQPSPWLPGKCVTQDMVVSEGLWLNQSLPFNITSSNTIFLFNCSPRLLVSPLNCTPSSLCHRYLESSGHVDTNRALQCAGKLNICCTFVAGGTPSAYKIRLHSSGCKVFRSILHLDINSLQTNGKRDWKFSGLLHLNQFVEHSLTALKLPSVHLLVPMASLAAFAIGATIGTMFLEHAQERRGTQKPVCV
ncbi:hypothetical protein Pyn_00063 [Prunus yedoensis var. nudiflora]|uniref:peptidylprolyl isomerase n=1 Tax=Prunus yedoensis var. nudiflora TaxID=2094558 RepID=A0A314YQS3_PRUYE|nr:hypothetical protein Pyn_00063 [Prunus yedoensis var. nudiflora]